jgi:lysozyme
LKEGERYGIDVSAHQDVIDWRQVTGDGITFAYIKATELRRPRR